jgi:hypothetical protein
MSTDTPYDLAKMLDAELSGWGHSEECLKDGHAECCDDPSEESGWYCEQNDAREDCEPRECECGVEKVKTLAARLKTALEPFPLTPVAG